MNKKNKAKKSLNKIQKIILKLVLGKSYVGDYYSENPYTNMVEAAEFYAKRILMQRGHNYRYYINGNIYLDENYTNIVCTWIDAYQKCLHDNGLEIKNGKIVMQHIEKFSRFPDSYGVVQTICEWLDEHIEEYITLKGIMDKNALFEAINREKLWKI